MPTSDMVILGVRTLQVNLLRDFAQFDLHTFAVAELDAEAFAAADIFLRDL